MEKGTLTIKLADGTQLDGLELNGNNFISKKEVTAETFRSKLGHVTITGDVETEEAGLIGEHGQMELVQVAHYTQSTHGIDDGYYFVLRDIPAAKLEALRNRGDIDYIAMMTDVTL